jgi:hypothetical protein
LQDRIAALRRFNRFYTRKLGVLEEHFLRSPFSLAETSSRMAIGRWRRTSAARSAWMPAISAASSIDSRARA